MKIGYARVSTASQNLDSQVDELKRIGCERIFEDKMTGATMDRPEFNKMLEFAREGDVVCFYSFSRVGRNALGLMQLINDLEERGIGFYSVTENLDTTTPTGKCMVTILAAMSELERSLILERAEIGREAARARGKMGGRPKVDQEKLRQAVTLYDSKVYSVKEITEATGISRGTLYKYLKERESR